MLSKIVGDKPQPLPDIIELQDGSFWDPVFTPGHAEEMVYYFSPEHGVFTANLYVSHTIHYMRNDENLTILIKSI